MVGDVDDVDAFSQIGFLRETRSGIFGPGMLARHSCVVSLERAKLCRYQVTLRMPEKSFKIQE